MKLIGFLRLLAMSLLILCACENGSHSVTEGNDIGTGEETTDTGDDDDDDNDDNDNNDSEDDSDSEVIEVLDMDCSNCPAVGSTVEQMVCAIDLCDPGVVLATEYTTTTPMVQTATVGCELEDTYEAVAHFGNESNDLTPQVNDSYAMMGTGPVLDTPDYGTSCSEVSGGEDQFVSEFGEDGKPVEMYDVVNWSITIKAPENAKSFQFKYVFFSTEYDEMVSSPYNDKFYAVLESPTLNDGAPTIINYTSCRVPDKKWDFVCDESMVEDYGCEAGEKYCYVAVNSAFSDCCWYPNGSEWADNNTDFPCYGETADDITDISGTGFECANNNVADFETHGGSSTGWIQTTWPITGGTEFTITFHLHDANEQYLDSQVIIDGFQFLTSDEDQGTIIIII